MKVKRQRGNRPAFFRRYPFPSLLYVVTSYLSSSFPFGPSLIPFLSIPYLIPSIPPFIALPCLSPSILTVMTEASNEWVSEERAASLMPYLTFP